MNAIMNNFKDFCNEISNIVEEKIISWHGDKKISRGAAFELVKHGYMLGGFKVDYEQYHPFNSDYDFCSVFQFPNCFPGLHILGLNIPNMSRRIYHHNSFEIFLKRDENALKDFYAVFKCKYDNCKSKRELDELKIHIAEALWNNTMHNSLTYVSVGEK